MPVNNLKELIVTLSYLLLFISALIVEVAVFYLLNKGEILLPLSLHFGLVSFLSGICVYLYRKGHNILPAVFFTLATAASGIFGIAIALLTVATYSLQNAKNATFAEWYKKIFPEEKKNVSHHLFERISFGLDDIPDDIDVEPFIDILNYGAIKQKQSVLEKIGRHFQSAFTPALMAALNSPESAVRVQAAAVVVKVESQLADKYVLLQQEIDKRPEDYGTLREFAEFCKNYVETGILDPDREQQIRSRTIDIYNECLWHFPDDRELIADMGRLHQDNNEPAEALQYFEELVNNERDIPAGYVLGYMESLYAMGEFSKVRQIAAKFSDPRNLPIFSDEQESTETIDLLSLWSNIDNIRPGKNAVA